MGGSKGHLLFLLFLLLVSVISPMLDKTPEDDHMDRVKRTRCVKVTPTLGCVCVCGRGGGDGRLTFRAAVASPGAREIERQNPQEHEMIIKNSAWRKKLRQRRT